MKSIVIKTGMPVKVQPSGSAGKVALILLLIGVLTATTIYFVDKAKKSKEEANKS